MLYIINTDYFMCSYILQSLKDNKNIKLITYRKKKLSLLVKVKRYLRSFWFNTKGLWTTLFYFSDFLQELSEIEENDRVLFFSLENLKDLRILDKEIKAKSKSVFLWNPVASGCRNMYSKLEYRYFMHRINMRVFTFDPEDAAFYRFNLINQVYRYPADMLPKSNNDTPKSVFYIGKEKNRSRLLANYAQIFKDAGLLLNWYILKDKHTKEQNVLSDLYHDTPLKYDTVLLMIQESDCMFEILQKGQSGATLRTLEAMFFKKKLLTNNSSIKDVDFYNPNNILIVSKKTTSEDVRNFINKPYLPVSKDIEDKYDIKNWINQFVE